jgi:hypothetical protein
MNVLTRKPPTFSEWLDEEAAREPFHREYWASHCEGFRVDFPGGVHGFVEEVRHVDDPDHAQLAPVAARDRADGAVAAARRSEVAAGARIPRAERSDPHRLPRLGRLDHRPPAGVDADVVHGAAEEHEVTLA